MTLDSIQHEKLLSECDDLVAEIFARCHENAPNFGVSHEVFRETIHKTVRKFLFAGSTEEIGIDDVRRVLNEVQANDLFLAIACSLGNERAWWEFDHQHRGYLERVARHLARTEVNAQDVVDSVYVELYGTRVVDGARMSKFATYSGRGTIRGWLRAVVWHALVDLHRARHDEVSLDEMTETVGEGHTQASFAEPVLGGETQMIDQLTKSRYQKATLSAIESAFASLDDHEKLLLLHYHVENLKLREIANMVQEPTSPLRSWFQRRAQQQDSTDKRIHESTIMRWLDRLYKKIFEKFRSELLLKGGFKEEEVTICVELATQDLASPNIYRRLTAT